MSAESVRPDPLIPNLIPTKTGTEPSQNNLAAIVAKTEQPSGQTLHGRGVTTTSSSSATTSQTVATGKTEIESKELVAVTESETKGRKAINDVEARVLYALDSLNQRLCLLDQTGSMIVSSACCAATFALILEGYGKQKQAELLKALGLSDLSVEQVKKAFLAIAKKVSWPKSFKDGKISHATGLIAADNVVINSVALQKLQQLEIDHINGKPWQGQAGQWFEERSGGRIKGAAPKQSLFNVLSFLALETKWKRRFQCDKENGGKMEFTFTNGKTQKVPSMSIYTKESTGVHNGLKIDNKPFNVRGYIDKNNKFEYFEIPYLCPADRDLKMVVILPDHAKDLPDVEKLITPENKRKWASESKLFSLNFLKMPQLQVTMAFKLLNYLKHLGFTLHQDEFDSTFQGGIGIEDFEQLFSFQSDEIGTSVTIVQIVYGTTRGLKNGDLTVNRSHILIIQDGDIELLRFRVDSPEVFPEQHIMSQDKTPNPQDYRIVIERREGRQPLRFDDD